MSSRQEEKRKRREERLAAEQADAATHARKRRLQLAGAGMIAVAAIAAGVIALSASGGDSSDGTGPTSSAPSGASIPAARNRDLVSAAKDAGCVLRSPAIEGRTHVEGTVVYKTNPPTSGNHNPVPALDGVYAPGNTPAKESLVHTLEHGRIEIQYRPGTPARRIAQLETLASEPLNGKDFYKVLVFENNTNMPYAVAATAWGQLLGCKTFNNNAFDAIRDFRVKYVDKGPEIIPPTN